MVVAATHQSVKVYRTIVKIADFKLILRCCSRYFVLLLFWFLYISSVWSIEGGYLSWLRRRCDWGSHGCRINAKKTDLWPVDGTTGQIWRSPSQRSEHPSQDQVCFWHDTNRRALRVTLRDKFREIRVKLTSTTVESK